MMMSLKCIKFVLPLSIKNLNLNFAHSLFTESGSNIYIYIYTHTNGQIGWYIWRTQHSVLNFS
jgi:hypothetical protein